MVGSKLGSTWLGAEGCCPSSWFPHSVGCGLLLLHATVIAFDMHV